MSTKRIKQLESAIETATECAETIKKAAKLLEQSNAKIERQINADLKYGNMYYGGIMKRRKGIQPFNVDAPRDMYIELEPYCYSKINALIKDGKIRYKDRKFIILD